MNEVLVNSIRGIKNSLQDNSYGIVNEQATKQAFIYPLLMALGYNVFNPNEVVPEAVADVGIKKGEKVDFKICVDNKDVMIIECKVRNSILSLREIDQLYRYYSTSNVKIAVLTNGDDYWFFTDSNKSNVMDTEPYEIIKITSLGTDSEIENAFDKYSKLKINTLNIKNSLIAFKFNKECEKIVSGMLSNDMPTYILEAIARQLGLATSYIELKKIKESMNIRDIVLNKVNAKTDDVNTLVQDEAISKNTLIVEDNRYDREVKLNVEYTYDVLLGKELDYHKIGYYIIGDTKYDGAASIQVYFKLIDYVIEQDRTVLNKLLEKSTRFQLAESFSPNSDVKAWGRKSKVVPNLMIYLRFSLYGIMSQIGYVLNVANLPASTVRISFKE